MIKTLTVNDYREMPWKNGGGITHEIFRYPETGDWDLRVSMAKVDSSGPFSLFPDMMRHLVLLEGNGMRLKSSEFEIVMDRTLEPYTFSGDLAMTAQILNGSNLDFNVIWKKDNFRCDIEIADRASITTSDHELYIVFESKTKKTHLVHADKLLLENKGSLIIVKSQKPAGTFWD